MKRIELDAETREAILETIREANEMYNEVYLNATELCKRISMFSPSWLEEYGWKLPREQVSVKSKDGMIRRTRWGYPLHQIQRMIAEGRLRDM